MLMTQKNFLPSVFVFSLTLFVEATAGILKPTETSTPPPLPPISLEAPLHFAPGVQTDLRWPIASARKMRGFISELKPEAGQFPATTVASRIQAKAQLFENYAKPDIDPYYGEQEGPVECSRGLIPAPQNLKMKSGEGKIIHGYAGPDGAFGTCDPRNNSQKVQVLLFHCVPRGPVYEARVFYPLKEEWITKPLAACK